MVFFWIALLFLVIVGLCAIGGLLVAISMRIDRRRQADLWAELRALGVSTEDHR